MLLSGRAPGALEGFLIWVDVPECEHIADPDGCCPECFERAMVPILEAHLDDHPECRPR